MSGFSRSRPLLLYAVGFALMVAAGIALVASARGFFESTRLLWLSVVLSVVAIGVAVTAVVWRTGDR